MHKLMIIPVAILVASTIAGCGKKAAGKSGGSCQEAVAASMRVVSTKLTADVAPEKLADALKLVGDAQLAACTNDQWPAAAIACLSAAKDNAAMAACGPSMGSANQSLAKVMGTIGPQLMTMMKPGKGPRAGDPPGGTASGSAEPAAGSAAAPTTP